MNTPITQTQEEREARLLQEAEALKTQPEWVLSYFAPMDIFDEPYRKELHRRLTEQMGISRDEKYAAIAEARLQILSKEG